MHLGTRNACEPRFLTELLAAGARQDIKNASGELAEDLDPPRMAAAVKALALRPRRKKQLELEKELRAGGVAVAPQKALAQRRGAAFMGGAPPRLPG